MTTTNLFADYQAQFAETQKQVSQLWDDSQKQLIDSQKQLVDRWMETFSGTVPSLDYSENLAKAIGFQQELINSTLNAQQVITNLAIDTQKQLWASYFQTTQKAVQTMPKAG